VYIRIDPETYKDLIDPTKKKNFPFRPGMSASADIQTRTHANVLSIPINAVTTRDKSDSNKVQKSSDDNVSVANTDNMDNQIEEVVFVVQADGTVKKQVVKTGIQDINYIEVLSGLKEGDMVVTGPYDVVSKTLKEKAKVRVVPKSELFTGKK
jgi:HlyD family secretion protein